MICEITVVELPLVGSFITAIPRPIFIERICPAVCRATNTSCRVAPNTNPHRICSPISTRLRIDSSPVSTTGCGSIGEITAVSTSARPILIRREMER
ncbi:hypothetical protein D3C75_978170 [compost metagenome]